MLEQGFWGATGTQRLRRENRRGALEDIGETAKIKGYLEV